MIRYCNAIILKVSNLEKAVQFYRLLGFPLETEDHGEGPIHYACDIGSVHFALFKRTTEKTYPSESSEQDMIGFEVKNLKSLVDKMRENGIKLIREIEEVPWGHRAIVLDPDGRPIELNQQ